jgi:hypothetical protein
LHWILFSFFLESEGARSSYCNLLNKKWQKESLQKRGKHTKRRRNQETEREGKNHENYK